MDVAQSPMRIAQELTEENHPERNSLQIAIENGQVEHRPQLAVRLPDYTEVAVKAPGRRIRYPLHSPFVQKGYDFLAQGLKRRQTRTMEGKRRKNTKGGYSSSLPQETELRLQKLSFRKHTLCRRH